MAASSTFNPSVTTSTPMPSPGMTASRISCCPPSPPPSRPASPVTAGPLREPPARRPAPPSWCSPPHLFWPIPIDRADERMQRRRRDARVNAATPQNASVDRDLEVGRGLCLLAGAGRVLVVVEHSRIDVDRRERVHQGRDRAVALASDGVRDTVERDVGGDAVDQA